MKYYFSAFVLLFITSLLSAQSNYLVLNVKVNSISDIELLAQNNFDMDHGHIDDENFFKVYLEDHRLDEFRSLGMVYQVLNENTNEHTHTGSFQQPKFSSGIPSSFSKYTTSLG